MHACDKNNIISFYYIPYKLLFLVFISIEYDSIYSASIYLLLITIVLFCLCLQSFASTSTLKQVIVCFPIVCLNFELALSYFFKNQWRIEHISTPNWIKISIFLFYNYIKSSILVSITSKNFLKFFHLPA